MKNIDVRATLLEDVKVDERFKRVLLDTAKVLLISGSDIEHEEIQRYGFKNVNLLSSMLGAEMYFQKNPEALDRYQIILVGTTDDTESLEVEAKIRDLRNRKNIIETVVQRYDYPEHMELVEYLSFKNNMSGFSEPAYSYSELFDRVVKCAYVNGVLKDAPCKFDEAQLFGEVKRDVVPLPTSKKDLKILYLAQDQVCPEAVGLAKELGINVTFRRDSKAAYSLYLQGHLGEYDIIIASKHYSKELVNEAEECSKQCEDTGRKLVMLTAYSSDPINEYDRGVKVNCLGEVIRLAYSFGGDMSESNSVQHGRFRVLKRSRAGSQDDYSTSSLDEQAIMKAIIEATVCEYNKMLEVSLEDFDLKTPLEYEHEFVCEEIKKAGEKEQTEDLIKLFDEMCKNVQEYLRNKRDGFIANDPVGIVVSETDSGISIYNINDGLIVYSITFSKTISPDGIRLFSVQTLNKRGVLLKPQTVGLYSEDYAGLESIPKRPNEIQEMAISSIIKKVNHSIVPLNQDANFKRIRRGDKKGNLKTSGRAIKFVVSGKQAKINNK